MRKAYKIIFPTALLSLTACSTLNESMQLGASLGAISGAAATYTAENSRGEKPNSDNIMAGAAIGLITGLITSHIVPNKSAERREEKAIFNQPCRGPFLYNLN